MDTWDCIFKVSHGVANLSNLKESVIKSQNYTMSPGPYLSEHVVISGSRPGSLLTIFRIELTAVTVGKMLHGCEEIYTEAFQNKSSTRLSLTVAASEWNSSISQASLQGEAIFKFYSEEAKLSYQHHLVLIAH